MQRRHVITSLIAVPVIGLLAACGSDGDADRLSTSDTTPSAPVTSDAPPSSDAVAITERPTSTDAPTVDEEPVDDESSTVATGDPVLSYTSPGGFTTREFAFQNPPVVLLTQDGSLITGAVTAAVFPGPLLPQHMIQSVTPAGVEAVLAAAEAAGLFADVDYSSEDGLLIADASTATLTITANGTTYEHEAYALGIGGGPGGDAESTPQRQALLDFLTSLQSDPASIIGAENLGEPTEYTPTGYQLTAVPMEDLTGFDPAPTVEPWPADSGVALSDAGECVEVSADAVGELLESATQLTFFSENDVTYQVIARPAYPGRSC